MMEKKIVGGRRYEINMKQNARHEYCEERTYLVRQGRYSPGKSIRSLSILSLWSGRRTEEIWPHCVNMYLNY